MPLKIDNPPIASPCTAPAGARTMVPGGAAGFGIRVAWVGCATTGIKQAAAAAVMAVRMIAFMFPPSARRRNQPNARYVLQQPMSTFALVCVNILVCHGQFTALA